ncbi:MAG TPA: site-specific DNA-methyltransferase [Clostridiaceae bacterium]
MGKEILGGIELNRIYQMDCLEGMKLIPDKCVDMILCDLPYGTTACKWDSIIPFDKLWEQYTRVIKDNGAIVLTASQPFTSELIHSNLKLYRYNLVWDKVGVSNPMLAKKQPLKQHEDICIFYKKQPIYNPQMTEGKLWHRGGKKEHKTETLGSASLTNNGSDKTNVKYPKSILPFSNANKMSNIHPTQKPVALFEWLIKTYTNEGCLVLDNCIGSGTTAVACIQNNRKWIGFETDSNYIELANKRLEKVQLEDDLNIY